MIALRERERVEYTAPDGVTVKLYGENKLTYNISGTGMAMELFSEGLRHGSKVTGSRHTQKTISFDYQVDTCSREEYRNERAKLNALLRPDRQYYLACNCGLLKFYLEGNKYLEIPVLLSGGLEETSSSNNTIWSESCVITSFDFVTCSEPFFQTELICKTIKPTEFFNATSIPAKIENCLLRITDLCLPVLCLEETRPIVCDEPALAIITDLSEKVIDSDICLEEGATKDEYFICLEEIGCDTECTYLNEMISIIYCGDIYSRMEIIIQGPIFYPVITNTSTGNRVGLCYYVKEGETVIISNFNDRAVITNNLGENLTGYLDNQQSVLTFSQFHMEPEPVVFGGLNCFNISGNQVTKDTCIDLRYRERTVGI